MESTPGTCIYFLTKFLDFKHIDSSDSSLKLNSHFTGTCFPPIYLTVLLLIRIQEFVDRKLLIPDTADIFNKCPIVLGIASLGVLYSPASVEIDVLHAHWIYYSLYYTT